MSAAAHPSPPRRGRITLVLGGARSGKSTLAEQLVEAHLGPLVYVATGHATDDDMAARIAAHQERRDPRYTTVEAGGNLAAALAHLPDQPTLLDALGTWLASPEVIGTWADDPVAPTVEEPDAFEAAVTAVIEALQARVAPTVVVSDEAGLGVHPETAIGRRWRDALGVVNQRVADVADDVLLVVAGRVLRLDRPEDLGLLADPADPADPADIP